MLVHVSATPWAVAALSIVLRDGAVDHERVLNPKKPPKPTAKWVESGRHKQGTRKQNGNQQCMSCTSSSAEQQGCCRPLQPQRPIAAVAATKEALWLRTLMSDLRLPSTQSTSPRTIGAPSNCSKIQASQCDLSTLMSHSNLRASGWRNRKSPSHISTRSTCCRCEGAGCRELCATRCCATRLRAQ